MMDLSFLSNLADWAGQTFGDLVQGLLVLLLVLFGLAIGYSAIWYGFLRHFRFIQEIFGLNANREQSRPASRPRQRLRRD